MEIRFEKPLSGRRSFRAWQIPERIRTDNNIRDGYVFVVTVLFGDNSAVLKGRVSSGGELSINSEVATRLREYAGMNPADTIHFKLRDDDVERMRPSFEGTVTTSLKSSLDDLQQRAIAELADAVRHIPEHTELRREAIERKGQEIFRKMMDACWTNKCPLSGIDNRRLLRASHIKPWADCDPDDPAQGRINPYNGLLLAAHLDAAFDAGLISFGDDGRLLRSPELSRTNFAALGVAEGVRLDIEEDSKPFLAWHRAKHGYE